MVVAVLLAIGLGGCALVLGVLWLDRRRLSDDDLAGVESAVSWAALVQSALSDAKRELRWATRDRRAALEATRPVLQLPVSARKRLTPEQRDAYDFLSVDLRGPSATANANVLTSSLKSRRDFFASIESQPLTTEQATAVVSMDNRVQVVAAAGSGKTSVMIARAAYAVKFGLVPPDRILLLAFNKAAAAELQQRIDIRLSEAGISSTGVRAATFHAFGLTVIGRATGRKPRLAGWLDGGQDVGVVMRIVDELRDADKPFRFRWDLYRLLFARTGDDPGAGEPDAYDKPSRTSGFRAMDGRVVRSEGERLIADWLFLNGIRFEYEAPYAHDVADETHSQYRPDFYYPDVDVWHEHWALGRDGRPPAEFTSYSESMRWKKATHARFGTTLVESTWAGILDQTGFGPLHDDLARHGIAFDWNPERAPKANVTTHDELATLMRTFLAHVKSNGLSRQDVEKRWAAGGASYRSRVFIDLFWPIHDAWQARLRADDSMDFEDMLIDSARHVEAGTDMGYDMVLVDEFQDASPARARLARALVDRPHRYLMTVGDDWQAINRFAGADISVMTNFNEWFGEGPTLRLQTTFRCTQTVADTAASFVQKNPRQLAKTVRAHRPDPGSRVSLIRLEREDEIPGAMDLWLKVLAGKVDGPETVDVLGRYGFDEDLLHGRDLPNLTVKFRTAHSSKGLEADHILIPRVVAGKYGFPSEIADDPVLRLVMSDADRFPHGEERRLFYVALTRARRTVTLITVAGRESAFVTELAKDDLIDQSFLSTAETLTACPKCGRGSVVNRTGPYGEFVACTRFACSYTRSLR